MGGAQGESGSPKKDCTPSISKAFPKSRGQRRTKWHQIAFCSVQDGFKLRKVLQLEVSGGQQDPGFHGASSPRRGPHADHQSALAA